MNIKLGSHLLKSWGLQQSQGGFIRAEKAISVAVLATDLVTNALKYAYPKANPGRYGCASLGTLKNQVLVTIEDNGVGWDATGVMPPLAEGRSFPVRSDRASRTRDGHCLPQH